jgi:hypothetical protein
VTPLAETGLGQKKLKEFWLVLSKPLPLHSQFEKMG